MQDKISLARSVEILNKSFLKNSNPSVSKLSGGLDNGLISGYNEEKQTFTMRFRVDSSFCNGKVDTAQVQGGFAAAMLDAVCANAIVCFTGLTHSTATLEQKVSFLNPVPANQDLFATATMLKLGKTLAFLEAELFFNDKLLAKASQTNKLVKIPRKPKSKL